jgi:HSP20 family protein
MRNQIIALKGKLKKGGKKMNTLMPIIRRNDRFNWPAPTLFSRFFEETDLPGFSREEREWVPNMDVSETDKGFVVRAEVPGIDKKDISITLTEGLLTIKGERKHEKEEKEECYHRRESYYGSFSRTFRFPSELERDKVDAKYDNGVLKVTIPKAEKAETKKIEIA